MMASKRLVAFKLYQTSNISVNGFYRARNIEQQVLVRPPGKEKSRFLSESGLVETTELEAPQVRDTVFPGVLFCAPASHLKTAQPVGAQRIQILSSPKPLAPKRLQNSQRNLIFRKFTGHLRDRLSTNSK